MNDPQVALDAAYEADAHAEAQRAYPDSLADQEAFLRAAGVSPAAPALRVQSGPITDPIERIVADALDRAGIPYQRIVRGLDFTLADGTEIECKAYYAERVTRQLARTPNVILIQGRAAAETFHRLLTEGRSHV